MIFSVYKEKLIFLHIIVNKKIVLIYIFIIKKECDIKMIASITKFNKKEEDLSILNIKNYFETYFKDTKEFNRFLHTLMHIKLTHNIFMNNLNLFEALSKKYGDDEEKLEEFKKYISDTNSGLMFLRNFTLIYGISDYKDFIYKQKEKYNLDTTILDNYIYNLANSEDYTKLSFIFVILSKATESRGDSIIELSYIDYLLPSLNLGKILDLENTKINFQKLFLLKAKDLECLLDKIYESSLLLDENDNSIDSVKHFLEKEKNEIILEKQNESSLAMKKYKQQLHENNFNQIYNFQFPDGYNVIVYYNNVVNAFIEDIECNGKSLVLLNDGRNAIRYLKNSRWKSADLYLFSFDDILSTITDIKKYLSYLGKDYIELITICDKYLNGFNSTQLDSDRKVYLQRLLNDMNKFESLKDDYLSNIVEKLLRMCKVLFNYYSENLQRALTPTESSIRKDLHNNKIINFPSTDLPSFLPFGYYASLLDKIYGSDFVQFEEIKSYFPDDEYSEYIMILYNAIRFINNVLRECDYAKDIESLYEYYDETITSMEPMLMNKKSNVVIGFKK